MNDPSPSHPHASPAAAVPDQDLANGPWAQSLLVPFGFAAALLFIVFLINQGLKNPAVIPGILLWFLIFLIGVVGAGFFLLRQKFRLAYGIIELLVGVVLAVSESGPAVGLVFPLSQDFSLLKEVAAIYVIVRAMENIGKGLKQVADRPQVAGQPARSYETHIRNIRTLWVEWLGPEG